LAIILLNRKDATVYWKQVDEFEALLKKLSQICFTFQFRARFCLVRPVLILAIVVKCRPVAMFWCLGEK